MSQKLKNRIKELESFIQIVKDDGFGFRRAEHQRTAEELLSFSKAEEDKEEREYCVNYIWMNPTGNKITSSTFLETKEPLYWNKKDINVICDYLKEKNQTEGVIVTEIILLDGREI